MLPNSLQSTICCCLLKFLSACLARQIRFQSSESRASPKNQCESLHKPRSSSDGTIINNITCTHPMRHGRSWFKLACCCSSYSPFMTCVSCGAVCPVCARDDARRELQKQVPIELLQQILAEWSSISVGLCGRERLADLAARVLDGERLPEPSAPPKAPPPCPERCQYELPMRVHSTKCMAPCTRFRGHEGPCAFNCHHGVWVVGFDAVALHAGLGYLQQERLRFCSWVQGSRARPLPYKRSMLLVLRAWKKGLRTLTRGSVRRSPQQREGVISLPSGSQ